MLVWRRALPRLNVMKSILDKRPFLHYDWKKRTEENCMKHKISLLLIIAAIAALLSGCGGEKPPVTESGNPLVTVEMKGGDKFYIELYPDIAPNTVNSFISLIEQGYYDGLKFHRIVKDIILQGGDPLGNGTGGPGYTIFGEFSNNGFENDLGHTRGVVSMARKGGLNDSAGSQFFIMVGDYPAWDGDYAAFGMVIQGMDVIDKISEEAGSASGTPKKDAVMKKVTVETYGVDYPEPEIIA